MFVSPLLGTVSGAINGSQSKTVGNYIYYVKTNDTVAQRFPVYDTQTKHTQGYSTTIWVTKSYTSTASASSSLSVGVSYYVTMAISIGVTQSKAVTIGSGVQFGVPENHPSGMYRIEMVQPRSSVAYLGYVLPEGIKDYHHTINYAPDKNGQYNVFVRYGD